MKFIVLDATPLGLLVQPFVSPNGDRCRKWLLDKVAAGLGVVLPEIADYEVRRELIRAKKTASVLALNAFAVNPQITYLPITTQAMRLAAELWAQARNRGKTTAHPQALDGDVILAAQVLSSGYDPGGFHYCHVEHRAFGSVCPFDGMGIDLIRTTWQHGLVSRSLKSHSR